MPRPPRPRRTLAGDAEIAGFGIFTNGSVTVRFHPAAAGTGVVFARTDLPGSPKVPAAIAHADELHRRTGVSRGAAEVQLTEHVLAALAGLRVDDCRVELTNRELPGLDGSARGFAEALLAAGFAEQPAVRPVLAVRRPVTVRRGDASVTAVPHEGFRVEYRFDGGPGFPVPPHTFAAEITPESFATQIAPARTFVTEAEVPALRAAGYGARVDVADLLVFAEDGTPVGNAARFPDEPARHKALDVVGDLALLGCDLEAHVTSDRGGHALNRELCRALLAAAGTGDAAWIGGEPAAGGPALRARRRAA